MTDPQHRPDPAALEGFDPDLPEDEKPGRRINLSTVQVGASAAAAVTSALAASFFGVAGTLIGAAVGSIVSTVAGAFYAESMKRAALTVKTTQAIVVRKVAATESVPLLRTAADAGPTQAHEVQAHDVRPPAAPTEPIEHDPAPTVTKPAVTSMTTTSMTVPVTTASVTTVPVTTDPVTGPGEPATPWWRRRAVAMVAMMLAGFAIAIGVISLAEEVTGGSVSGDKGTSTVGRVFGQTGTGNSDETPTPTPTPSASPTASATPGATATAVPVAPTATATAPSSSASTTQPTASATTVPSASASVDSGQLEQGSLTDGSDPSAGTTP